MDSLSKIPLSTGMVEEVVRYHFGSSARLAGFEELHEGYFNAAARLELGDGRKMVLKAAPLAEMKVLRYERGLMRAEVESMRLVRERTSVPVPEVLVHDTSRRLLPSDFFIMEMLPGVPFHRLRAGFAEEDQRRIEREMGWMVREMSTIRGESFGYWAQPASAGTPWRECFASMVWGVLQDGLEARVELGQPYEAIYGQMEVHFGVLDAVDTPRLVHWDLWDGNVFVDPQTRRVTGLIDFERVMWADPLIEAIFMRLPPAPAYVEGFGGPLFEEPGEVTRRLLYNAYLFLIMIIECTYRQYPDNRQETWSRMMLGETLGKLNKG